MPKTKTEKIHQVEYRQLTHNMQQDVLNQFTQDTLPINWNHLDTFHPVDPHKTKVTLRLDADMLRWFRKLGPGYQNRINQVLAIYWRAVLAGDISRYASEEYLAHVIDWAAQLHKTNTDPLDLGSQIPSTPPQQGEHDDTGQTVDEGDGGAV